MRTIIGRLINRDWELILAHVPPQSSHYPRAICTVDAHILLLLIAMWNAVSH